MKKRILVVAAHPDDEILGCGATLKRLINEGHDVYTLILGEGITSRDQKRNVNKRRKELAELRKQIDLASKIIGVKKTYIHYFPDNRFDSLPILEFIKVIENVKREIKPAIIFTHYEKDLNIDHQITYRAVITATRPLSGESVKEIYSFEIPSSTEWSYPQNFSPNIYYDVTDYLKYKLEAMARYKIELREYPHPRSINAIEMNAAMWGIKTGVGCAEAFSCVRLIR